MSQNNNLRKEKPLAIKEVDARDNQIYLNTESDGEDNHLRPKKKLARRKKTRQPPVSNDKALSLEKPSGLGKASPNEVELKARMDKLENMLVMSLAQNSKDNAKKHRIQTTKVNEAKKHANQELEANSRHILDENRATSSLTIKRNGSGPERQEKNLNDPVLQVEYMGRLRDSNFSLVKELEMKDKEISRLRQILGERETNLGQYSSGFNILQSNENMLKQEIDLLKRENQILEDRNTDLRRQLNNEISDKKSEGYLMLENDSLKRDVVRLIKMLQSTNEYRDFADMADASGSIHYLKSIGKFSLLDLCDKNKNCKNIKCCEQVKLIEDERMIWVPQEAHRFAHEFRLKYNGMLTETLIEQLLFELNKIWNQREQRIMRTVKSRCSDETGCRNIILFSDLRRKLANTPSLEITNLKSKIKRLKKDLKNAYRDNRELFNARPQRLPSGADVIKSSMMAAQNQSKLSHTQSQKNQYYKEVSTAYQRALEHNYPGNIYYASGAKTASSEALSLFNNLRAGVEELIATFKGSDAFSKDQLSTIQTRDDFLYKLTRKLDMVGQEIGKQTKEIDTECNKIKLTLFN